MPSLIVTCRALVVALALLAPGAVLAGDAATPGALKVDAAWTPQPPNGAKVGAGYLTISNTGTEPARLIGGSTAIAERMEVHTMKMDGGIMRMRELPDGLLIKPGETVTLKPGADHLMFMGLKAAIAAGETFEATLKFKRAGDVKVTFAVMPLGTRAPATN